MTLDAHSSNRYSVFEKSGLATIESLTELGPEHLARIFWPLDLIFKLGQDSQLITFLRCILFLGIPAVLMIVISWCEKTLRIDGEGVGLLEHTGFIAFFIIHILLIILLPRTITKFASALTKVSKTIDFLEVIQQKAEDEVIEIIEKTNELVRGTKFTKTLKISAVCLGFVAVIYNAINTTKPLEVYRHEVWDSINYLGGYVVARVYLCFCWGIVLSVTLYGLFLFCYIIYRVYSMLGRIGPIVTIRPLSPDQAGGLKHINSAVMAVVVNVLPLSLFTVALVFVHGVILPIVIGTLGWVLFVCLIFFFSQYSLHDAMFKKKKMVLEGIEKQFNIIYDDFLRSLSNKENRSGKIPTEFLSSMYYFSVAYEISEKMPVWPFNAKTLSKFFSFFTLPLLLNIPKVILTYFF